MPYDHHTKAGNPGDVVKHPAFVAVLDGVLEQHANENPTHDEPLKYLDIFAGHAWHPLLDEDKVPNEQKRLEWKDGIGTLQEALWNDQADLHFAVRKWRDWYVPRRNLLRGWYPGSSTLAADMCRECGRSINMTLFDISDDVRADLRRFFCPLRPTEMTRDDLCVIGQSLHPTRAKQAQILEPDFVFVDPPGWRSTENPTYPRPADFLNHVLGPRGDKEKATLVWMPAGGQDRTDNKGDCPGAYPWDDQSRGELRRICDAAARIGYEWTAVRWKKNSYSACILLYNKSVNDVRAAIECIVGLAGPPWECKHS